MSKPDFLMRSLMFVPAHNEKLLNSSLKRDADVLVLDIEDSVPPHEKQNARDCIKKFLAREDVKDKVFFPRVNDIESGELLKDVYQLTIPGVTGFMYPKVKKEEDVYFISKLLDTIENEKGIPIGTFKLLPIIETTGAVLNIQSICQASPRIVAVVFGYGDYLNDLQGKMDPEGKSVYLAKNMITLGARAAGVLPIDTPDIDFHNHEKLERDLILGRNLGFEGKVVLHPSELELVNKYYSPTPEEVTWAEEMVRLSDEAEREGKGVAMKDGKFIGPPLLKMAKEILDKQALIEEKKRKKQES